MKTRNPTIRDVAEKAGVSVATVSRIVNGQTGHTEDTKTRVLEIIEELGYKPNALARSLVNRNTLTIGVLLPSVSGRLATALLKGIEDAARALEYSVIVCNTDNDGQRTMEYLQVLGEKQVEGIIYASEWVKDEYGKAFKALGIPVVLVSTISEKFDLPYVKVDDRAAAFSATKWLTDKGHREVAMIAGTRGDLIAGAPRVQGFRQALEAAGLPLSESRIIYGNFGFRSGIAAMGELMKMTPRPTAVFAASDEMAAGALTFCHRASIKVPDDVSVIGYDDTEDAEMTVPPLTTVHQPIYEIGERAAQILLDPKQKGQSIIMPFFIAERESVRRL
jgi:LacI family transcriptional regulator